jgi:uncharacterized membrane protein
MSTLIILGALIAPFLYATTNHIDKILLEKYFKDGGVETLMMFSAILSIVMLPIVYLIDPTVLTIETCNMMWMIVVGALNLVLLWCYLQAMSEEEPTVVIMFYQLTPVCGLILGHFVLDEMITTTQFIAMALILAGASIMTVAIDTSGNFKIDKRTIGYMIVASLCWAGESTLFKKVGLEENVWRSLFWENLSMAGFGILIFLLVPKLRRKFMVTFRENSQRILTLNVTNELLYMAGNAAASLMVMKILVAINLLMNSFQPFFVLVLGLAINRYWPGLSTEATTGRFYQKAAAIAITGLGVYLIGEW